MVFKSLASSAGGTIPTGLRPSAQGWPRQRTTLGQPSRKIHNPNGVESSRCHQGMQPFQGCGHSSGKPRVARTSQPWAGRSESLQDSFRESRFGFIGCWLFDVLCGNLFLSRSDTRILASHNGVVPSFGVHLTQPFQDSGRPSFKPRVARSSQPWAGRSESLQDSFRESRFGFIGCWKLDVLCRNLFLSRSDTRILASHKVAGRTILELCPERTWEKHIVSTVLSGREVTPRFPATAWLANFRRRFATKNGFYKACSMLVVGCFEFYCHA